ncbi:DUF4304 domain-containing protein [Mumia sp. DW29H23]|uniref:DUF4304 domain-containing protein n=1 Tax=Mumia sp. DW29H23 TaxID=3421241 RepID=UPI003D697D2D
MTVQMLLKAALRDRLGPSARRHGFKGSAPTWRKQNADGDWGIVNLQSSSWSSADRLPCIINVAVAPEPWLRWNRQLLGDSMPKNVTESLGLYRDRLHPTGTPEGSDRWWEVTDADSAVAAAEDMIDQLETKGWPLLDSLLEPGAMLGQVRSGSLGDMKRSNLGAFFARAEALLLMDGGLSAELDECLEHALREAMPSQRENALLFDRWVREEAGGSA